MKESKNPSAIRSKKEITSALYKLMEIYPYNEISVKQIVMETGLVRKTFYRNFDSKDDVLNSYINEKIVEYTDALLEKPEDPLAVIFDYCDKNRDLLMLLHKNNMLPILLVRLNAQILEISKTTNSDLNPFCKLYGEMRPDYLIAFNVGAIFNVIFKWVDRGMVEPLGNVRELIGEYFQRLKSTY